MVEGGPVKATEFAPLPSSWSVMDSGHGWHPAAVSRRSNSAASLAASSDSSTNVSCLAALLVVVDRWKSSTAALKILVRTIIARTTEVVVRPFSVGRQAQLRGWSRASSEGRVSNSVQESGARAMARSRPPVRAARRQHRWPKPSGFALPQGPPFALRHSECSDLHIIKVTAC